MRNGTRARMWRGDHVRVRRTGLTGTIGNVFEAGSRVTYFVVYDRDAAQPEDSAGESFAEDELETRSGTREDRWAERG
jgi:hypothetical protein